jgi:tRNA (mo5U34)-methyltransferase
MPLMNEKRVRLAGLEVSFALDAEQADRLKRHPSYRYVVGPALSLLRQRPSRSRNGHHAAAPPPAPVQSGPATPEARAVLDRIAPIDWYHTIDLPHGVVTPGFVDHRNQVSHYGLPVDMRGMRALDVATFDGYWAFEMERRGADVTAIDIDSWLEMDLPRRAMDAAEAVGAGTPLGTGFAVARELLGSRVNRVAMNVYSLSPERVGSFDLVFLSDLLIHLRDPQRALEAVFSVVREGGRAVIAEPYNLELDRFTNAALSEFRSYAGALWWLPSVATLKAMMTVAGFDPVTEVSRFRLDARDEQPIHKVVLHGHRAAADPE